MDLAQAPLLKGDAKRFDAASFAFALVLRLAFSAVFLAKGLDTAYGRDLYYNLAQAWLGWAPAFPFDATHPPLYTATIAAVLGLFRSPSQIPVIVLQCLLGAASVPLTRAIGERLGAGPAARLAALWVALDPGLIFFTPQLGAETMYIAMQLVLFLWLLDAVNRKPDAKLTAIGLWGGFTALCRSNIGGYPAFLFLVLWRARGFAKAFLFCAVLGLGWLAPSVGWSVRNYLKYGRVVPVATVMGWNMYEGFTLDREEVRRRPFEMGEELKRRGIENDPIVRGDYFKNKVLTFMRERPAAAVKIVLGKAFLFWRPFPYDPHTWWQRDALGVYFTLLFAFALYGLAGVYGKLAWHPVLAYFVYLTALHSIFFTSLRYRLPLEPFLCLLAAVGAARLLEARKPHRA